MLNPRGNCLGLRPCFICSPDLKETLYKFPGKEEVARDPRSWKLSGRVQCHLFQGQ